RPAGTSPISSTSPATQDEAKISEGIARANGGSCTPYRWPIPQKRKPIHHRLPASRHTYAGLVRGPASFDHLVGAGEERLRHSEAERLRRLHIHDELIF